MGKHFFIPIDVNEFEAFHLFPYEYLTQSTVRSRLNWGAGTGMGHVLDEELPFLIQEYMIALAAYRAAIGTTERGAAHEILMQKQEALGDKYDEVRDALNSNPNHTIADNVGSHLPAEKVPNPPSPTPVMNESYPTVDNIIKQLAIDLLMSFHDSADGEKKHKKPYGQGHMIVQYLLTDLSAAIPTQAEILASGMKITCSHSPFRHNFGADNAGKRISYITWWVNKRGIAGLVSDVRSLILG